MKKLITFAIVLITAVAAQAQKEVLFKIKYLPAHNYTSSMKMDMNMEMNMTGDSSITNKLKQGQKFPMIMQMESANNVGIKTGVVANSAFPIDITTKVVTLKMKMNGVEQAIPIQNQDLDQTITGKCTVDGKITMDLAGGSETVKQQMLKMVDMLQNSIKFPEKPMKIGDTFTQDVPMDIPIAGTSSTAFIKGTYNLLDIKDHLAYFGVVFNIDMKLGESITMKGDGTGKFVYDINQNFPTSLQETLNMDYNMVLPQLPPSAKMVGKMTMLIDQTTSIAAN